MKTEYDKKKAHTQLREMAFELDKFEFKYYFSDAHSHDINTNEGAAFDLLNKTLTAFRELEAKI
jgi:hypothetical protein